MMRQQLNGMPPDDDQRGLTIGVSGDTLLAVTYQAQGLPAARPLSLDFMWQVRFSTQLLQNIVAMMLLIT